MLVNGNEIIFGNQTDISTDITKQWS